MELAWTDNSADEDGFKVERSPNGTDSWTLLDTVAADVVTYNDAGPLTPGTEYFYRVSATKTVGGDSGYASASATTLDVPADPTGLAAVASPDIDRSDVDR